MVAHACRQLAMEWNRAYSSGSHHTIHHVVHGRFRFVGMWRVLEPALASISLERIGRPFADIGERDATHNNGRGYVGRSMARSTRGMLTLLRQPSGGSHAGLSIV